MSRILCVNLRTRCRVLFPDEQGVATIGSVTPDTLWSLVSLS